MGRVFSRSRTLFAFAAHMTAARHVTVVLEQLVRGRQSMPSQRKI